jgi:hypothetical protein
MKIKKYLLALLLSSSAFLMTGSLGAEEEAQQLPKLLSTRSPLMTPMRHSWIRLVPPSLQ